MSSAFRFNKSIRVEVRPDRVTGDAGVLLGRQVLSASGVDRWLSERIEDARDPRRIRHSTADLVRTACLLPAQGRRDHDDATVLRDDPAFRLATSGRAGTTPLAEGRGLASQPTLSRLTARLAQGRNRELLREGLARLAGWRAPGGPVPRHLTNATPSHSQVDSRRSTRSSTARTNSFPPSAVWTEPFRSRASSKSPVSATTPPADGTPSR